MVERGERSGEMTLNTQDGWVKVRVEMDGAQVRVEFATENASMRETLRTGLDDLKTTLSQRGFGGADVSFSGDQTPDQRMRQGTPRSEEQDGLRPSKPFKLGGSTTNTSASPSPVRHAHQGRLYVVG